MPKLLDTVVLRKLTDSSSIEVGAIGVIVAEFDQPKVAYEVEFTDDNGATIDQIALLPDQFEVISSV